MRNLRWLLVLPLVLTLGSCCIHEAPEPVAPPAIKAASLGDTDQVIHWMTNVPAVSLVANTTVTHFDTTGGDVNRQRWTSAHRFLVSMRCDQDVTLLYEVKRTGSSTWRTFNGFTGTAPSGHCTGFSPGSGAGDTVKASVDTACDYLVLGPDSRIQTTTGGTPPTTCEMDIGYYAVRDLGM